MRTPIVIPSFRAALVALVAVASGCNCDRPNTTNPVPVTVEVTPWQTEVLVGRTQQFAATVRGTDNPHVAWGVIEGSAGGTIDTAGKYTAPPTPGVYHVMATSL